MYEALCLQTNTGRLALSRKRKPRRNDMTRSVTKASLISMATMAASMCFAQDIQVNIDGQAMAFSDASR